MPTDIVLFTAALAAAYLVPGPDMLLVLDTGARRDGAAVRAVIAGLATARAAHVTLAALGVAALLQAVPEALSAVRLAGAAWLAWLGWRIAAAPPPPPPQARADRPKTPAVLPFRRAVLTNLLNPKALVFCSVLLPQFVDAASVTPATDFAGLGTALVAVGALFDTGYAAVGWRLGGLSQRSPRSARIQQRIAGLALVAFGLHLAAAG